MLRWMSMYYSECRSKKNLPVTHILRHWQKVNRGPLDIPDRGNPPIGSPVSSQQDQSSNENEAQELSLPNHGKVSPLRCLVQSPTHPSVPPAPDERSPKHPSTLTSKGDQGHQRGHHLVLQTSSPLWGIKSESPQCNDTQPC